MTHFSVNFADYRFRLTRVKIVRNPSNGRFVCHVNPRGIVFVSLANIHGLADERWKIPIFMAKF